MERPLSASTRTPAALEQVHQAFIQTYNITAHQGLLQDQRIPPIPVEILGAEGIMYTWEELTRHFAHALFPRKTNRYGCVTLRSYHFATEEGLPHTQVLLWVSGEPLRAAFDNVMLVEYHWRYDWRDRKVKNIREGMLYPMRIGLSQGSLVPLTSQDFGVVYHARWFRHRALHRSPTQQLLFFEVISRR
jgi:hypothetical protein